MKNSLNSFGSEIILNVLNFGLDGYSGTRIKIVMKSGILLDQMSILSTLIIMPIPTI